jgi:hypothetical protein
MTAIFKFTKKGMSERFQLTNGVGYYKVIYFLPWLINHHLIKLDRALCVYEFKYVYVNLNNPRRRK